LDEPPGRSSFALSRVGISRRARLAIASNGSCSNSPAWSEQSPGVIDENALRKASYRRVSQKLCLLEFFKG